MVPWQIEGVKQVKVFEQVLLFTPSPLPLFPAATRSERVLQNQAPFGLTQKACPDWLHASQNQYLLLALFERDFVSHVTN
jgi:hypothetical protein